MIRKKRTYRFAALIAFIFFSSLSAQDKPSPPEKKEPAQRDVAVPAQPTAPLPKIDLPEFLITGQETIDLPVSSKTAVEEDRVYVPGAQSPGGKDANVNLGGKEEKTITSPSGQLNGRVAAGIGNYTSPFMDGWFGKNYDDGGVLFHANYASSNGHVQNANWQRTGIGMSGDYTSPASFGMIAGSRLSGGLDFSGQSFRAYGSTVDPSQQRTLNDIELNLGLASNSSIPRLFDAPVDYSVGVKWSGNSLNDSADVSENDFGVTASGSTEKEDVRLNGSVEYLASSISTPSFPGADLHSPQWFTMKLSGMKMLSPAFQASLALQQYFYRGVVSALSGRFFPQAELRYFMNSITTFSFSIAPDVVRNTLATLVHANNYVLDAAYVRPSEIPFSISLGSEVTPNDVVQGRASLSYRTVQNFPLFVELNSAKVWDVVYLPTVSVARVEIEGSYAFSPENSATLTASLNSTKAKDSSGAVPNIPALSLGASYWRSLGNGIDIEGYVQYQSKRWKDFTHTASNAGFIDIGGRGEYQFAENFQAVLRIDNLLDQHYYIWDGYVERPTFISVGVTYKW